MENTQFKVGNKYGNDLTIEVLKRTAKTITIKSLFGEKRIKLREYTPGVECVYFRSWIITANEDYNADKAAEISMYNAYYK
ncbi:hypothetical protein SAMN05192545_3915 [Maribacter dokdonensis]|uniref:Uncharacterized protein n=1 Tax=Maribacter dokdonensis TaxID=320912 RepID=A0ABY0V0I2_9FLAO|nr:hypothetical protein [Maribacter dokdonensis]SDT46939.1 hypothetical protein SAMN05192545_3915 [Maribacter dokdonensis]